jgi:hypothetical protein
MNVKIANMSQTNSPASGKKNIESYDIANSYETMHLAQDLARFIKENKLFHHIQGKAYVNVEGWQYAGARLGILPVIEELVRIPTDNQEVKYQAQVKLYNLKSQVDGQAQVVGSGYAICSNQENGKRNYQEFAIASMAQTRAIGKAYRNILAWIIRAAGYEPTPAEEMDYMSMDKEAPKKAAKALAKATSAIESVAGEPRPEDRPPVDRDTAVKKEASVKQKTELLLLLNNKVITNEEKNKMIENINGLDSERASKSIARLKKVIEERQGEQGAPAGSDATAVGTTTA